MTLKLAFKIGQVVYLKADQDEQGVITGIVERAQVTSYRYLVSWADRCEVEHVECELLSEKEFKSRAD